MDNKPTYRDMVSLIVRIHEEECDEAHPDDCSGCHLYWTGLCKEIEQFARRLKGEEENQ